MQVRVCLMSHGIPSLLLMYKVAVRRYHQMNFPKVLRPEFVEYQSRICRSLKITKCWHKLPANIVRSLTTKIGVPNDYIYLPSASSSSLNP